MVRRRIKQALKAFALLSSVAAIAGFASVYARGGKLLSVQSGSMAPSIREGDLVSVKRVPSGQIAVGDVITFINPADKSTTITHRVVAIRTNDPSGNNIVTKGDANPQTDIPIEATSVIGEVNRTVPRLGYALDFLRTWPGIILLIYIPALVVITGELRRLSAYYRSKRPHTLTEHPTGNHHPKAILLSGLRPLAVAVVVSSGFILPTYAVLQNSATLTGNTISVNSDPDEPPEEPPEEPGTSTTCTNNTNTTVNNSSNQTATSGNATSSNNKNGGSATSGDASNSNSSSTTVTVNNSCPPPSSTTP